jgi:hypothetical protein
MIMISCDQLPALEQLTKPPPNGGPVRNPFLSTLIQLLNAPSFAERCTNGGSQ